MISRTWGGKAVPYGAYDIARNRAVVNVGISHDTAELAIESIRRWWRLDGRRLYREADRLLICADRGGSNGTETAGVETGPADPGQRDGKTDQRLPLPTGHE